MATPPVFSATCPGCHCDYQVPADMAGLLVTCETCHTDFVLPDSLEARPRTPASRAFLKNAMLLLTGAALVWGLARWRNHPAPLTKPGGSVPMGGPASITDPPAPVHPAILPASRVAGSPSVPLGTSSAAVLPTEIPVPSPPAPVAALLPPPAVPPAAATLSSANSTSPPGTADAARLRRDSRLTLERFLLANSVPERLALSQHPDKIRREFEAHYLTHPMGALPIEELAFLTDGEVPGTRKKFHLYNVVLRDHESAIPMAVEETEDGYRVDWPTFIECYTHRLRGFFAAPSAEPGQFRVMLRRAHYFGPPVPGQDTSRIAYTVEPPGRDDSFHVWVDKDSMVYREKLATGERAGWDAESYVIVELLWRGDEAKGRWVGLRRIVTDSWRME